MDNCQIRQCFTLHGIIANVLKCKARLKGNFKCVCVTTYNLSRSSKADIGPVDVVSRGEHPHHSTILFRGIECNHRCEVMDIGGQDRLETEGPSALGTTVSGPLCFSIVNSVPMLLELVAGSIRRSNRCVSTDVDTHKGICQPTVKPSGQDSITGSVTTSKIGAGSLSVEITTVIQNKQVI